MRFELTLQRAQVVAAVLAAASLTLLVALYAISPVAVTVGGRQARANRIESVESVARRVAPDLLTSGDLLDVEGKVLEHGKGAAPRILVSGRDAKSTDLVWWNRKVTILKGANTTEDVSTTVVWDHFGYQKVGDGALPVVTKQGRLGVTEIRVGSRSGAELERVNTSQAIEPTVQFALPKAGATPMVALTFDDGPSEVETAQILDVLAAQDVKATFFVIGENVERYPKIVSRAVSEGHQVAMHAYGHPNFKDISPDEITAELNRCADAVQDAAGVRPTWVRPPYGGVDGLVYTHLNNLDYRIGLWNVDPADYSRPGMQKIINRVVYGAFPGGIVLMHDGGGDRSETVAALPGIIGELRDAGYQFVTVEELAKASEVR